ncbi:BQ2448_4581 [Microbotryum intermedium]|uniref:BQ2448_4581 protein n=1 Tax=Microbotryum intermedium TaxID=269621 RepID=A0A238FF84_9BASI|nr:BQ2448_4581 [Microbotryum intermedium]
MLTFLIIEILSRLGWQTAHYSDRERQSDLASIALTHPAFLHATQYVLYSSSALTIRNAGRSASLASTVSSKPDLALLVTSLVAFANTDGGHPSSVTTILNSCPNVASLSLGGSLFLHPNASDALKLATLQTNLTKFVWWGNDLSSVVDLLSAWTNLENLSIMIHDLSGLRSVPKPSYHLKRLSITGRTPHQLTIAGRSFFSQLFGSTQPGTLEILELRSINFEASFDPSLGDPILAPCFPFLRSLTLQHLRPYPLVDWLSLCESHNSLRHLEYSPFAGEIVSRDAEASTFSIPKTLRSIQLMGRKTYLEMGLSRALERLGEDDNDLKLVKLSGPYASDPGLTEVGRVCKAQGIELQVRREFSD